VLKDETVWEKPLRFYPEHFLDAQGHFVKHEAFMPFSAGDCRLLGCLSFLRVPWRVKPQ
jgi:cytochrome P450 family 2 subfamily D